MSTKTMVGIAFVVTMLGTIATVLYGLLIRNYQVAAGAGCAGFFAGLLCIVANSELESSSED